METMWGERAAPAATSRQVTLARSSAAWIAVRIASQRDVASASPATARSAAIAKPAAAGASSVPARRPPC
jgi:hypothetical protein